MKMPLSVSGSSEMSGDEQPTPRPIEPGEPELENVLFVVLGVALTVVAVYRLTVIL